MDEMISLAGRVAIVTGAGRGLGRAYALDLARRGAAVVVTSTGETADAVVAEIESLGGTAVAHRGSVADPGDGAALVSAALTAFGRIDALVNNAGIVVNAPFEETPESALDELLAVHVRGTYAATRAAYPHMRRQGFGRLVFTSSASGLLGLPGQSAYGAAKAAVVGLCNVVALEGAPHGILANAVLPIAFTNPGRTPAAERLRETLGERGAMMTPEHVAGLVTYLCSEACGTSGVYSAFAGRYARVLTAVTPGWLAPPGPPPTAEDVAAHLEEITREEGYAVPRSLQDEVAIVARAATAPAT